MSTRIRLQRHGKKGKPFFHIVVADQRAKRDGRFIEKLGTYNPNTNPATINLNFEGALKWIQTGAQPSDTARAILSYKGVMMKDHLLRGVKKGALTEAQAEAKFEKWLEEKNAKIGSKVSDLAKAKAEEKNARLAAEKEINEARAKEFADAEAAAVAEAEAAAKEELEVAKAALAEAEGTSEEAPAEEASTEEAATEEAPAEETPAEEASEEKTAE